MYFNQLDDYNHSLFFDEKHYLFSMTGEDAISFLDRVSTNNIEKNYNSSRTIITDNKGSVIDIISYKIINNQEIIFISNTNLRKSIDHMEKHIIIDDVQFKLSGKIQKIVFYAKKDLDLGELTDLSVFLNKYIKHNLIRYELFVTESKIKQIDESFYKFKLSKGEKNLLDIKLGYLEFNKSINKVNPLELELSEIVSFEKGCYIGQEVIARLYNYDKVTRKIVNFKTQTELEINASIKMENKIIGKVLSVQKSSDCFLGLCLIKKKYSDLVTNGILEV